MQFRIDTLTVTDEERRAIKWGTNGHRTPASREQCAAFAEKAIRQALDEVLEPYRNYMRVLESARDN